MSLRTGGAVGRVLQAIINPDNLKIEGFYCLDRFSKDRLILLSQEIRDIVVDGLIVNDHEAMSDPEDLVRFKKVTALNFELIGKKVVTTDKRQLGKVNDYAVDSSNMFIKKMYVTQSFIKNIKGGQLGIDRSQIVEITDKKVVVQEATVPFTDSNPLPSPAVA